MSLLRPCVIRTRWLNFHAHIQKNNVFSKTNRWVPKFNREVKQEVETYWKTKIKEQPARHGARHIDQQKYYVLSMFPYPSGKLHMGHVRVYAISDAMARYHRLSGKFVIHPMGWDAFGLPAENAAIERGVLPQDWTYSNIASMREQLEDLCCSFDWEREFATCDPEYYKWTQEIFLQMYKDGLVYQKEAYVNWDPVDQTVLADEQIDEEGRSWRSGAVAEKKLLKQWYVRTTAYSQSLLDGLEEVNEELWKDVINLQKHWIGKCDGMRLEFQLKAGDKELNSPLSIFTKTPEGIFGASHILLAPNHPLNTPEYYLDEGTDVNTDYVLLGLTAYQPLTKQTLPVYVANKRDFGEHLDSHIGIPSYGADDREFAKQKNIPWKTVIDMNGFLVESEQFSGLKREEAFYSISKEAQKQKCGGEVTSERARDWLISRQRYWGTPIPLIHCPKYGTMAVPYEDLPVKLPKLSTFSGKGHSPLAQAKDWLQVKCPRCDCDSYATRETDTMDTFVDSSWYYLRYLDPNNQESLISKESAHRCMPVDLYIGGKEHAIMHLYYARFISHYLHNCGVLAQREPFVNLLTQGMVMGQSYKIKESGRYIPPDQVDLTAKEPVEKETGASVTAQWEKMSKSKYNGVDPQEVLEEHGCDATRLCILSNVAPKSDRHWNPDAFLGIQRWQSRMWSLVTDFCQYQNSDTMSQQDLKDWEQKMFETRNYFLKEVTYHMEETFLLSVAISRLQGLTNALKKCPNEVLVQSHQCRRTLCEMVIMIAPFAPLFASELWTGLGSSINRPPGFDWDASILDQAWPTVDPDYKLSMKVKINGKDAYEVALPMILHETTSQNINKMLAMQLASEHKDYAQHLGNIPITGTVFTLIPQVRVELNYLVNNVKKKKKKPR